MRSTLYSVCNDSRISGVSVNINLPFSLLVRLVAVLSFVPRAITMIPTIHVTRYYSMYQVIYVLVQYTGSGPDEVELVAPRNAFQSAAPFCSFSSGPC